MDPAQPLIPEADPLLVLALVVVGGLLAGQLARRLHVAGVTGQILLGVAIGHSGLNVFSEADVARLAPMTSFAIGLIAVAVGGHLNLRRLGGARKRLGMLLLAESTITPILVFSAAVLVGASWPMALLLSALAVSTAPATIVALVSEMRAKGVFTKTLLGAVALNNLSAILLFEVAHLAARVGLTSGSDTSALEFVIAPLRQLIYSAALGGVLGAGLVLMTRHVLRTEALATASVLCVLLTAGLGELLGLSSLLACLFLGVTLANLTPDKDEIVESAFVNVRHAIFAVFFTLAGMHLDLNALVAAGALVIVVFFARVLGKISAGALALRWAGTTANMRRHIGGALVPQAGVAVGLLLIVTDDPVMAPLSSSLLAVGLAVVAANELVGPFLLRSALVKTGDAGRDRDRILDF
ncbi:MAG: cation:proton antiporter, partial [Planctomycetota bacterium]